MGLRRQQLVIVVGLHRSLGFGRGPISPIDDGGRGSSGWPRTRGPT